MASRKAFLSRNLQDVDAASPDDNDSLVWDAGADKWTPVAISGGGGAPGAVDLPDLGDVTISDPQEGDILYYDAISGIWVNDRTAFAEIFTYGNSTATVVATGSTFTKFDQYQNDGLYQDNQPDSANNQIIFNKTGVYLVTLATSFETDRAAIDIEGGAFLDDVEQTGIQFRRYVSSVNDEGAASAVGLVNVTASGQLLDFRLKHDWGGDVDVTVTYANLTATHVVAAGGGGGGGVTTFLALADTPSMFTTYSGAFVKVNSTEDALEFSHIVDYIDFNTSYGDGEHPEGRLHWDMVSQTLELGMPGGDVRLQIGQEMHMRVKNDSGGDITNGQAVYVDGATGNFPTIALARADETGKATIALATEDIDDGQFGYITTRGMVRDIDTDSFGIAGTLVWLSDTPGALQAYPAGGTSRNNVAGMVIKKHATEGVIVVMPFIFNYVDELSGVTILNPIEDDVLSWNAASGIWINKQIAGGGGASTFLDLTDVPDDYSGQAGLVVAVNDAEDALEFIAGGGGGGSSVARNSNIYTREESARDAHTRDDGVWEYIVAASGIVNLEQPGTLQADLQTILKYDTGNWEYYYLRYQVDHPEMGTFYSPTFNHQRNGGANSTEYHIKSLMYVWSGVAAGDFTVRAQWKTTSSMDMSFYARQITLKGDWEVTGLGGESAGEGHITLMPEAYSNSGGSDWGMQRNTLSLYDWYMRNASAGVQNDYLEYKVYLVPGTYTLMLVHHKNTSGGIVDIQLDGASIGSIDFYASLTWNVRTEITDIVITEAGLKTLKFLMSTKNASSSSYTFYMVQGALWRTA